MKTKIKAIMLSFVAALFVACGGSDNGGEDIPEPVERIKAVFTTDIANWAEAENPVQQKWNENDEIGIFMVKNETTEILEKTSNIKYVIKNASLTATGDTIIFPEDEDQLVDFIAYYPYTSLTSGLTYRVTLTNQDNVTDLLYSNNAAGRSSVNPATFMRFNHVLSRMVFTIQVNPSMADEDLSNMSVIIKGMKTVADFSLMAASWSEAATEADITTKKVEEKVKYELLTFPQTIAGGVEVIVEYGADKNRMGVMMPVGMVLQQGEERTFNLILSHDELTITESGIENWTE